MQLLIPGFNKKEFNHLIMDFNGTIALDGDVLEGVKDRLEALSKYIKIHVVTGDTHGNVKDRLKDFPCEIIIIPTTNQTIEKAKYIDSLEPLKTIAVGNGRNDGLMLKKAGLGVSVIQKEGLFTETLKNSDIIYSDINDFLDALLKPARLKATLRD